jgi:hypothetical protein
MNETLQLIYDAVNLVTSTTVQIIAIYLLVTLVRALRKGFREGFRCSQS